LELITVPHPCEGVPLGASGTADPAARSVLVGVYRIIFFLVELFGACNTSHFGTTIVDWGMNGVGARTAMPGRS